MSNTGLMTRAEYARHRGVSRKAVTIAVQQGRISLLKGDLIDPEIADAQWTRNTRAKVSAASLEKNAPATHTEAAGVTANGGGSMAMDPNYNNSRARREAAEADMAEMERDKLRGELLECAAVRSMLARLSSSAQQALTQMPARLGPVVAAESDPIACTRLIQDEVYAVLHQIVEGCATLTAPHAAPTQTEAQQQP